MAREKKQGASFRLSGRVNISQQTGLENCSFLFCVKSRRNWNIKKKKDPLTPKFLKSSSTGKVMPYFVLLARV